eukprot:scaffold13431_cov126-Isochrysis_galbana.AAC.3
MVYPNEGEHWGHFADGSLTKVLPMRQTLWYTSNLFGLKTVDEAGKIFFNSTAGDHLDFSRDELNGWLGQFVGAATCGDHPVPCIYDLSPREIRRSAVSECCLDAPPAPEPPRPRPPHGQPQMCANYRNGATGKPGKRQRIQITVSDTKAGATEAQPDRPGADRVPDGSPVSVGDGRMRERKEAIDILGF